MSDNQDYYKIYKDIKKRVKSRYEARKEFFSHLAGYVIFMILIYIVFGVAQGTDVWIGIDLLAAGWTIGLVIHAVLTYFDERTEIAIDQEMERMGIYQQADRKPKREDVYMHLSDDGELLESPFVDEENPTGQVAR